MLGVCYIVGSAPANATNIVANKDDYIIAADGGYDLLIKNGIKPDLVIGDFDSVDSTYDVINSQGVKIKQYPAKKDDTDVGLAIKEAVKLGYKKIKMYGVLGGYLDHTLANLQLLVAMSRQNIQVELIGDREIVTAVTDGQICFETKREGRVSVFSADENSYGVTIEGLMYEVNDITLTNTFPVGVSNEFVGRESRVKVSKGTLIIVYEVKG